MNSSHTPSLLLKNNKNIPDNSNELFFHRTVKTFYNFLLHLLQEKKKINLTLKTNE